MSDVTEWRQLRLRAWDTPNIEAGGWGLLQPCTRHWCHQVALLPGRAALRCVPPPSQLCRTHQQYLISQEMSPAAIPTGHQELSTALETPRCGTWGWSWAYGQESIPMGHHQGCTGSCHRHRPQQQGASSCRACRSCRALSCARGTRRWAHGHGAAQGAQMEGAALPPRFSRKHFHLANSVLLICMRVKLPCLLQSGLRSRH